MACGGCCLVNRVTAPVRVYSSPEVRELVGKCAHAVEEHLDGKRGQHESHQALDGKHAALADDSGLWVNALNGDPGIYSARWAGPTKDFAIAMARIERELLEKKAHDFSAKFVCALSIAMPHGEMQTFEGEVHGRLTFPPRGTHGFGYDPIFIPNEGKFGDMTFGEIDPHAKNAMSHRARAFEKLLHSGILAESF